MATSVTLPALGESVTEGTVTRWLKQPGEEVQADEPLLEISTDKVDTEIPSPASGTLLEIKVAEDETVEVGTELAVIGDPAEANGGGQLAQPAAEQEAPAQGAAPASGEQAETQQPAADEAQQAEAPQDEEPTAAADTAADAGQQEAEQAGGGATTSTSVTLPALGESVTEGTVTRWLKQVGEEVQTDEPLLEISTDKVDTEIPSPASGTLLEIKVAEDETVEVGTELAVIGATDSGSGQAPPAEAPQAEAPQAEAPQAAAPSAEASTQPIASAPPAQPAGPPAQPSAPPAQPAAPPVQRAPAQPAAAPGQAPSDTGRSSGDGSPYVTPLVRKLAAEHSVDLASLTGTGVGGRIRKQDVLAAAEQARAAAAQPTPAAPAAAPPSKAPTAAPSPLRGTTEKMSRLRATIARRMVESLQVSAQLTTVVEVDVTAIARLRQQAKAGFEGREGVKLSFLPFFAKAAVEALKAHPSVNATIDTEKGEVTYFDAEHLGIAVDTERGLLVPVIRNAGDLNIAGLARKIADLADRTRNNKIMPDELSGGTFTLTNTGSRGALFDTPIINQPQVGILGTGTVVKRPVVTTDETGADSIAIRSMAYLSMTYDHRLVDGADAARFLTTIKQRLEGGQFEGDLGI
jgi:pyruvate dehydrogenase E2 component (dihydrolipoamide acetyltransferase)